jgi:putative acetyltransferase
MRLFDFRQNGRAIIKGNGPFQTEPMVPKHSGEELSVVYPRSERDGWKQKFRFWIREPSEFLDDTVDWGAYDSLGELIVARHGAAMDAVRRVNTDAFGRPAEADLLDAPRRQGQVVISLVAEVGKEVVGNAVLTPVSLMPSIPGLRMLGLGPIAVLPAFQRQGIGSMLVGRAIKEAQAEGWHALVVLGHPKYYMRFGFAAAHLHGIRCEFDTPKAFMILELLPGTLPGLRGVVKYQPEFSML